jgi:hypothetical protein
VIWKESKYHIDNCYICCCDVKGYNSKNKKVILYPNLPSVLRCVVHGPEVPVPQRTEILENASTDSSDSGGIEAGNRSLQVILLQDGDLVHCGNIPGLMQKFGVEYNVNV